MSSRIRLLLGYDQDQVFYHLRQIDGMGFIEDRGSKPMNGIVFGGFTAYGCDFLERKHEIIEEAAEYEPI